MKRIFIIEDHEDMQLIYKLIFRKVEGVHLVALAGSANEALAMMPEVKPDLVIVDISLPGMNGMELTTHLKKMSPSIKVLVASGHETDDYSRQAIESGADAFVGKSNTHKLLEKVMEVLQI